MGDGLIVFCVCSLLKWKFVASRQQCTVLLSPGEGSGSSLLAHRLPQGQELGQNTVSPLGLCSVDGSGP